MKRAALRIISRLAGLVSDAASGVALWADDREFDIYKRRR